jgi:hypothetical protein
MVGVAAGNLDHIDPQSLAEARQFGDIFHLKGPATDAYGERFDVWHGSFIILCCPAIVRNQTAEKQAVTAKNGKSPSGGNPDSAGGYDDFQKFLRKSVSDSE